MNIPHPESSATDGHPEPPLYLIAHRVRGQPAFDIAQPIKIGDEKGWIIPTSGHRAYPYWSRNLDMFMFAADEAAPPMPDDWPDHYRTTAAPRTAVATAARGLLAALGLGKSEPINRRL